MSIVSDTGPLAYLVAIDVADALPELYGNVYIPPAVQDELAHERCPAASWISSPPAWLHVSTPHSVSDSQDLDAGERQAIAIALEVGVHHILIDEKQGRSAARAQGLKVAGTLAVIVDGHARDLFDGQEALDRLEGTNFYASRELLVNVRQKLSAIRRK